MTFPWQLYLLCMVVQKRWLTRVTFMIWSRLWDHEMLKLDKVKTHPKEEVIHWKYRIRKIVISCHCLCSQTWNGLQSASF